MALGNPQRADTCTKEQGPTLTSTASLSVVSLTLSSIKWTARSLGSEGSGHTFPGCATLYTLDCQLDGNSTFREVYPSQEDPTWKWEALLYGLMSQRWVSAISLPLCFLIEGTPEEIEISKPHLSLSLCFLIEGVPDKVEMSKCSTWGTAVSLSLCVLIEGVPDEVEMSKCSTWSTAVSLSLFPDWGSNMVTLFTSTLLFS